MRALPGQSLLPPPSSCTGTEVALSRDLAPRLIPVAATAMAPLPPPRVRRSREGGEEVGHHQRPQPLSSPGPPAQQQGKGIGHAVPMSIAGMKVPVTVSGRGIAGCTSVSATCCGLDVPARLLSPQKRPPLGPGGGLGKAAVLQVAVDLPWRAEEDGEPSVCLSLATDFLRRDVDVTFQHWRVSGA